MQFDVRLWSFTKGVRGRITYSVMIGMISTSLGVVRLGMLGWLIGLIFQGHSAEELIITNYPCCFSNAAKRLFRKLAHYDGA